MVQYLLHSDVSLIWQYRSLQQAQQFHLPTTVRILLLVVITIGINVLHYVYLWKDVSEMGVHSA